MEIAHSVNFHIISNGFNSQNIYIKVSLGLE